MNTQTRTKPNATVRRQRIRLAFALVGAVAACVSVALTAAQFVGQLAGLRRLSHGLGVIGLGGERRTTRRGSVTGSSR